MQRILAKHEENLDKLASGFYIALIITFSIGSLILLGRMLQSGATLVPVLQLAATIIATVFLLARNHLPNGVIRWVTFFVIIGVCFGGVSRFGLLSPALFLLVILPGAAAVALGARHAFYFFAIILLGLLGLFYAHVSGSIPIEVSTSDYMADGRNWVISLLALSATILLSVSVGLLYRRFWLSTVTSLIDEEARRLKSEGKLDRAEARWRAIGRNISGVIFDYVRYEDGTHRIIRMSDGSRSFWELEPEDIEKNMNILFERIDYDARVLIEEKVINSMQTLMTFDVRLPTTTVSGEEKWFQMSCRPKPHENGATLWHCLVLDVTREVTAELEAIKQAELVQQSQRQKSIGQLTGGVAHDFNNILAVVMGNLELLREDETKGEAQRLIDNAISASLRGADLTRHMLAYSRQAPLEPKVLNLNEVLRKSKDWFGRTIPANIRIETSFLTNLWKVEVDESSAVSALLNLVVNARDAMPDGGKITIETSNVRVDDDYIHDRGEDIRSGRYVLVAISDTGTGIAPEILEEIFDPFFTTKVPGQGTGLGLSMIIGFMKQSRGTARVYSEVGDGTTFKLYFPAYSGIKEPAETTEQAAFPQISKGVKILLVEDEREVLETLNVALTREGYNVHVASSGDIAAAIFEEDSTFDLVVTDIVMPGNLQGTTLSHHLRGIRPDIPIVFMSGYANEATVHGNGLRPEDIRLMKPIRRTDLIVAIEKAIKNANDK